MAKLQRKQNRVLFHTGASLIVIGLVVPSAAIAGAPRVDRRESAVPVDVVSREDLEQLPIDRSLRDILNLHNLERAAVGSPNLRWNPALARGAQQYADQIAVTGSNRHSPREGREGQRENLTVGPRSGISPLGMAQVWVAEKQNYTPGIFPQTCSGDWYTCAHYTQMIWSETTDVGCGYARQQFDALVCRYSPPGNQDGKYVVVIPTQDTPQLVFDASDDQPGQAPPAQPEQCNIPESTDWARLMNEAALKSGLGRGQAPSSDATAERQWKLALDKEKMIQDQLMTTLANDQKNVATLINAYLKAASEGQAAYNYLASSSSYLQGLLQTWTESKVILEKADLAFALANLGVGGIKLGFKAYKFFTKPGVADEAAAGVTQLASASDNLAGQAAGASDNVAAAAGETQVFNRTIIPPGQNPNVPGMRGFNPGTSSAAGSAADAAKAAYDAEVAATRAMLAEAQAAKMPKAIIDTYQDALDGLLKAGPKTATPAAAQASQLAGDMALIDKGLIAAAEQAGLKVDDVIQGAKNFDDAEIALMRAIANAKGWHDIPKWAVDPITNLMIQGRKILAGADDVAISPKDLELLKSLKTYVESQGMTLSQYLRTAAGEIGVGGKQVFKGPGGIEFEKSIEVFEGIVRYYDEADISLLLKILDAGTDASKLRATVNPVTAANLNGLGRANQALTGCNSVGTGLTLQGVGGVTQAATKPGDKPTDQQLTNVLDGTGKLGEVGLGNAIDQFGVTDRITAGQSLPRIIAGELWEFFTSPSATTGSIYYTLEAQDELLRILRQEGDKLQAFANKMAEASRALGDLKAAIDRMGLNDNRGYLSNRGPAELRGALRDLERTYEGASDDFKRRHKDELAERKKHINDKLAALAETVSDLQALGSRLEQTQKWLDSLRLNPDGSLKGPVDLFNPLAFVRLGSISLYLRGMGADAFGLTADKPFRMVPASTPRTVQPKKPELTDEEAERRWNEERERAAKYAPAYLDEPETEVDDDFSEWLNNLPGDGD